MSTQTLTMAQELAALRAENAALKARPVRKEPTLTVKVAKGGGISVYGLGKFPVTLFKEQWVKVQGILPEIERLSALPELEYKKLQDVAIAKALANPMK